MGIQKSLQLGRSSQEGEKDLIENMLGIMTLPKIDYWKLGGKKSQRGSFRGGEDEKE